MVRKAAKWDASVWCDHNDSMAGHLVGLVSLAGPVGPVGLQTCWLFGEQRCSRALRLLSFCSTLAAMFVFLVEIPWCHTVVQCLATLPWLKLFSTMVIATVCKCINVVSVGSFCISVFHFYFCLLALHFCPPTQLGLLPVCWVSRCSASVGSLACLL